MAGRLVFYTKEACPLCESGWESLRRPAARLGIVVERTLEVPAEYAERLPVVVDGGGRVVLEGRFGSLATWMAVARARFAGAG